MPLLYDPVRAYQELSQLGSMDAFYSEAFLDAAVQNWLFAASFASSAPGPLRKLAGALEANQDDFWLSDLLNSPSSKTASDLLQQAISSNYWGDPEHAAKVAAKAIIAFSNLHNIAGVARSRFELVFALQRQSKGEACDREALALARYLGGKRYTWLSIQTSIERGMCQGMMNNYDQALMLGESAELRARQFHYPALALRAVGLKASMYTASGHLRQSWQVNEDGLRAFWEAPYTPERGYQFYSDLGFATEPTGQWDIAVTLGREALSILEKSKHLDFKAIAHFQLAKAEKMAGEQNFALEEFRTADTLFSQLPKNRTTKMYEANVQIAALEADLNALPSASKRLDEMGDITQFKNFIIQLGYWKARAAIARQKAETKKEQADLAQAVSIGNKGFGSRHKEQDRWAWHREVGTLYRRLLELEISTPHDAVQALADWENFRSIETLGNPSGPTIHNLKARSRLRSITSRLKDASFVVFAAFQNQTTVWIADNRGIQEFGLPSTKLLMDELSAFAKACSDPGIPLEQVRAYGHRAYEHLIAPLEKVFEPGRTLFIEADEFSGLPWAAMVTRNGDYFGSSYTIANIPELFHVPGQHLKSAVASVSTALIVAPAGVTFDGKQYPPLPQVKDEIQAVQRVFPHSVVLQGGDATAHNVLDQMSNAAVFHFAGHGLSREYGGELLLSGENSPTISASVISRMRLDKMRLAVLSACSTAKTEGEAARDPNGLVRAFLHAGANTVIASRWDADSKAASEYMRQFYGSLNGGVSVAGAIQKAREHVREQTDWIHPYYWAVFDIYVMANH